VGPVRQPQGLQRQSANAHPDTGRHYHYQPKNKDSGQPLELDPATVRKHQAGWITIGHYAINPQSQRCKWIAIDADYDHAFFDLGKLKGELELDGVSAALEMSRRGGHLWIFCEQPLLAEQCRVYIYNVALRLGVPIKGPVCATASSSFPGRTDSLLVNSAMLCVPPRSPSCQQPPLLVLRRRQRHHFTTCLPQEREETHRT